MSITLTENRDGVIITGGYAVAFRRAVRYTLGKGKVSHGDMRWVAPILDGDDTGALILNRVEARAFFDYARWAAHKVYSEYRCVRGALLAYTTISGPDTFELLEKTDAKWDIKFPAAAPAQ